jgi:hypothetical protein
MSERTAAAAPGERATGPGERTAGRPGEWTATGPGGRAAAAPGETGVAVDTALARAAAGVLLDNWTGGYTVPSRTLYPHQWSWDSAFVAIGLRHLSPRRAQRELEGLFGTQWTDGRVPHVVFDPAAPAGSYFPGPDFWRAPPSAYGRGPGNGTTPGRPVVATSGLIQPPVHALAAWETFRADPAEARRRRFLDRLYPRLVRWHAYLTGRRGHAGLVAIVHPWESGMDNSPSWDEPLARIEPAVGFRRRDLSYASADERPTDTDYGRYIQLAAGYRDRGYADGPDPQPFAVLDPMVNALLAASELALAEIAGEVAADPRPHLDQADGISGALVAELFDADAGLFFARDLVSGRLLPHRTVAGLVPLLLADLPVVREVLATGLGEHFRLGALPIVPSYDLTGPAFEPGRYWRGPGWFNMSWLIWRGLLVHGEVDLAERLRQGLLDTAWRVGFREYVDPRRGTGCGAGNFSWTAAIVLDLLAAGIDAAPAATS